MDLPILKGTLDLLVLKALSTGPKHGFEITSWIEQRAADKVEFDDSAIYHALYRMEKRALIESKWGVTENNRRARYYRLTAAGEIHLEREAQRMLRYADALAAILGSRS